MDSNTQFQNMNSLLDFFYRYKPSMNIFKYCRREGITQSLKLKIVRRNLIFIIDIIY